ncbi:MAG TPA: hypothetical protein PKA63_09290 [Oligoflexia bacterium]|nr:hypothetical protein [Oligoflexia bacterium]HMP48847.1 hypothetical protein [Oligoflexia bacterium]
MNHSTLNECIREVGYPVLCHEHVGGSDPLKKLWRIARERGIRGVSDWGSFVNEATRHRGASESLDSYLRIFHLIEAIQSGRRAIRGAIKRVSEYLLADFPLDKSNGLNGVRKMELRLNPFKRTGLLTGTETLYDADTVMAAIAKAVSEVELDSQGSLKIGIILCFARDFSRELNEKLSDKIIRWQEEYHCICGIDLAGPESSENFGVDESREHFARCYNLAGNGKLGRTVHLGETDFTTPEIFIKMIEALNPDRVAHPITAIKCFWHCDNRACLETLKNREIVVELCPNSNFLTNRLENWHEFALVLEALDEFGIGYLFGTDNPALEGITWSGIVSEGIQAGAISEEQLKKAITVSQRATFVH